MLSKANLTQDDLKPAGVLSALDAELFRVHARMRPLPFVSVVPAETPGKCFLVASAEDGRDISTTVVPLDAAGVDQVIACLQATKA